MISGEKTFPGTKIFNPNIATLMKRVIIAGIVLASLAACNTADPESTYLVDPSKEDPVADFDYTVESSSGKVLFTNKSTGSIAYRWIFGDASGSSSLEENPSFIYRQSGSYTVSLRASNGYTSNVKEKVIEYTLPDDVVLIEADGNLDDWANVPWREDVNTFGVVTGIKTAATSADLYVLMEGTPEMAGNHIDISFNMDDNLETGNGNKTDFDIVKGGPGADMFVEDGGFFVYNGDGTGNYTWIEGGWPDESEFIEVDGKVYKEYRFNLEVGQAYVETPSDRFTMNIWLRDSNWAWSGATQSREAADAKTWDPFYVTIGEYRDPSEL